MYLGAAEWVMLGDGNELRENLVVYQWLALQTFLQKNTFNIPGRTLRPRPRWITFKITIEMKNVPIGLKICHFWWSTLVIGRILSRLTLKRRRGDLRNHPFLLPWEQLASKIAKALIASEANVEDLPFSQEIPRMNSCSFVLYSLIPCHPSDTKCPPQRSRVKLPH